MVKLFLSFGYSCFTFFVMKLSCSLRYAELWNLLHHVNTDIARTQRDSFQLVHKALSINIKHCLQATRTKRNLLLHTRRTQFFFLQITAIYILLILHVNSPLGTSVGVTNTGDILNIKYSGIDFLKPSIFRTS